MKRPRFSIITPTKDRPEWLPRAIASVCAQTFEDWEMIVYDNGDEFAAAVIPKDERVRYAFGPASGPVDAFNKALGLATGEIVHPLGDDDRLAPHALELVDAEIGEYEWLVALTDYQNEEGVSAGQLGGPPNLERLLGGPYYLGGAVYWRRSLTDRLGGFDPAFDGAGDYELYVRFTRHAEARFVPAVLYLYTDHAGTDSHTQERRQREASDAVRRMPVDG